MQVAILEMPQEGVHRVTVDDQRIDGYITKHPVSGNWQTHVLATKGGTRILSPVYRSKEAAGLRLAIIHFEKERARLRKLKG